MKIKKVGPVGTRPRLAATRLTQAARLRRGLIRFGEMLGNRTYKLIRSLRLPAAINKLLGDVSVLLAFGQRLSNKTGEFLLIFRRELFV